MNAGGAIAIQGAILPGDGGLSHLNAGWEGDAGMAASVRFCDVMGGEETTTGGDVEKSRDLYGGSYENTETGTPPQGVREDRLPGMGEKEGATRITAEDAGTINEKSKGTARNLFRDTGVNRETGAHTQRVKEELVSEMAMRADTRKTSMRSGKHATGIRGMSHSLPNRYGKEGTIVAEVAVMRSHQKNTTKNPMVQVTGTSDSSAKGQIRHNMKLSAEQAKGIVSHDGRPATDTRGDMGNIPEVLMEEGTREHSSLVRRVAVDRFFPEGFQHIVVQGERCVGIDDAGGIRLRPSVLVSQIADTAGTKLASESGRVRMVLNPPQLGTVDMDVSIRNNKVCAVLHTDNSDVRHALQSNMEQLKISLHNQGLTVDSISVFLHDKSDGSQYGFAGESLYGGDPEGDGSQLPEDREESFPEKGHPGIDGCINVFA